MNRGVLAMLAVTAACGAAPPPLPRPPPLEARIEVSSTCPPESDARARLAQVVTAHGATQSDLIIRVEALGVESTGERHELQLRVSRSNGEVGLDRRYSLGPSDCASASALLALSVDRFLSSFPEWAGPPRPPRPPAPPTRWFDLTLVSALNSMWRPLGVDGHAGALVDLGAISHRVGGGVLVRASIPQAAGSGRFQQTSLLATASYRFRTGRWRLRGELRGGALLVSGVGFATNRSDFLPWYEGAVYGGRVWSWGSIGIEVAASALRHKAVTSDGLVSEDIPLFRVGVASEFGLASQNP